MNYWPAEPTNLTEFCTPPLIDMIRDLSVTGRQAASQMYGARGWTAHHNTDIWRISGMVDTPLSGHVAHVERLVLPASVGPLPFQRRYGLSGGGLSDD